MRANGSFAICGNAEFFSCRMWKSDKGFAERSALAFSQITPWQLSAFCNPHSAKYPRAWATCLVVPDVG